MCADNIPNSHAIWNIICSFLDAEFQGIIKSVPIAKKRSFAIDEKDKITRKKLQLNSKTVRPNVCK